MKMQENKINPYVRFARYLTLSSKSDYEKCVPLDARLFYVQSGFGIIEANGAVYQMSPGRCLIIAPGTDYRLMPPEKSVTYLAFNFDFTASDSAPRLPVPPVSHASFKQSMLIEKNTFSVVSAPLYVSDIQSVEETIKKAEREYTQKRAHYETYASSLLGIVLVECLRCSSSAPTVSEQLDINKVMSYIQEHFSENLTNKKIGKIFGFHSNYMNDEMKRKIGVSMHGYLLNLRIEKAITLLEGHCSVSETARLCGFKDVYYFSRYFKKATGLPPSCYFKHL